MPDLEWFYNRLSDEKSRALLVDVIAYRIMGYLGIKLPLANREYKNRRKSLEKLSDSSDKIGVHFNGGFLSRYDLATIGYPISLYLRNPITLFEVEQYACNAPEICAKEGDVVIDGGGCYGDTALYFAHKVGEKGSVHTFEFVPSNLNVMQKSFKLNPHLESRITVEKSALWSFSGLPLYVRDNGPASRVSAEKLPDFDLQTQTRSIDEYVADKKIASVDFIKLDIEGAEEHALRGAEKTIRSMHPTIAVSLYHSPSDFVVLPRLLDRFFPDYRFYLKHATMHAEETVLFATVR